LWRGHGPFRLRDRHDRLSRVGAFRLRTDEAGHRPRLRHRAFVSDQRHVQLDAHRATQGPAAQRNPLLKQTKPNRLFIAIYATRSPFFTVTARLSTAGNILAGSRVTTTSTTLGPGVDIADFSASTSSLGRSTRTPWQPKACATVA